MYFKVVKFIYNTGRRKGYSEIIAELQKLQQNTTRTREGAIVRAEVGETVKRLQELQKDEL